MEIIYANPSLIFSYAEISYLAKYKDDDFFNILETMEIC